MRKLLFVALLALTTIVACDTKDPAGPASVNVVGPSPFTTTTTTSVPVTVSTVAPTSSTSSTSSIPFLLSTTYIALGAVPPNVPNVLTLSLRQTSAGNAASSWRDWVPFLTTAADPVFNVLGFYTTPGGGGGAVQGQLVGTLADGAFEGTLTSVTPECTAEREFSGTVNTQSLQWFGGSTRRDCKGSPLGFSTLTMLATSAPPPVGPPVPITTSVPLSCGYGLSAGSASFSVNGGVGSVELSTGPTCGWTAQRFVDWVTVQPTAGTGPTRISFAVSANPGAPRSTTLVIAGQQFVISQSNTSTTTTVSSSSSTSTTTTTTTTIPPASTTSPSTSTSTSTSTTTTTTTIPPPCTYALNPAAAVVDYRRQPLNVDIVTQAGCAWTIDTSTLQPWTVLLSPASGTGPALVRFDILEYEWNDCDSCSSRVASIRIANLNLPVTQTCPPDGSEVAGDQAPE